MQRLSRGARYAGVGLLLAAITASWPASTAATAAPLPDGRRYEMVSPPDKNGADVLLTTERTRVSTSGNAFGFAALAGFADAHSVSVASDYISVRSTSTAPSTNGWTTRGITPMQRALSLGDVFSVQEPLYNGPYSLDLNTGVFFAASPLTDDASVANVPNLYRRTDLLTAGPGTYDLLTGCPLCETTGTSLPPLSGDPLAWRFGRPWFVAASADFQHVLFESLYGLTVDAPEQPAGCDPSQSQDSGSPNVFACGMRLYEWDQGTVRLAGVLPDGTAADASFAGQGAVHSYLTPGVVSDGSDGHRRIFFTQPTDATGATLTQVSTLGEQSAINDGPSGNLFMRVDHATTEQLNVSERSGASAFSPASFLTASRDGTRSFFMTAQALTDDAPVGGQKIYMYDATKPASYPHNLSLVTIDRQPDGQGDALGAIGVSDDGHYFYFAFSGELVAGGPLGGFWIYLWHDGQMTRIGPAAPGGDPLFELLATGVVWKLRPIQARVSPDGRTLLFPSITGEGLTGYDHGDCRTSLGTGCRELYVYRADTDTLACASCNPSGAPATGPATDFFGENMVGGTRVDPPNSQALTGDGRRVFFSSPDALVPEDTNGRIDAYEYDVTTGKVALLSTGKSTTDSYFVNADPTGDNAFIVTRQRLVGWDRDDNYDIYDARVGGGFPEPPSAAIPCADTNTCHGPPHAGAAPWAPPTSSTFDGAGNLARRVARKHCKRGRVLKRVHGKRRCVKRHRRHRGTHKRRHGKKAAKHRRHS